METVRVETVGDMSRFAEQFVLRHIVGAPAGRAHALVIGLIGPLGAGKTTFMQGVAAALGVLESVTSPTFVLSKIYALSERGSFGRLVHMDAYRLEGSRELGPLGWDEIVADPHTVVMVEWADHIEDALPTDAIRLYFSIEGESARTITKL